jgi:hypothetical protein
MTLASSAALKVPDEGGGHGRAGRSRWFSEAQFLKCECLGAIVCRVSKGDWQSDPPEGDGLLDRDHSIEWMWAALELIPGQP